MNKILTALIVGLLTGLSFGNADQVFVSIEKIEGTVVELPKAQPRSFDSVRLSVTFTSSPNSTKDLYSTISRKTEYSIQNLRRPRRDEVILVLPKNRLPAVVKVGDKIRILGYGIGFSGGSGIMPKYPPTPLFVDKIEINPRG